MISTGKEQALTKCPLNLCAYPLGTLPTCVQAPPTACPAARPSRRHQTMPASWLTSLPSPPSVSPPACAAPGSSWLPLPAGTRIPNPSTSRTSAPWYCARRLRTWSTMRVRSVWGNLLSCPSTLLYSGILWVYLNPSFLGAWFGCWNSRYPK